MREEYESKFKEMRDDISSDLMERLKNDLQIYWHGSPFRGVYEHILDKRDRLYRTLLKDLGYVERELPDEPGKIGMYLVPKGKALEPIKDPPFFDVPEDNKPLRLAYKHRGYKEIKPADKPGYVRMIPPE